MWNLIGFWVTELRLWMDCWKEKHEFRADHYWHNYIFEALFPTMTAFFSANRFDNLDEEFVMHLPIISDLIKVSLEYLKEFLQTFGIDLDDRIHTRLIF